MALVTTESTSQASVALPSCKNSSARLFVRERSATLNRARRHASVK